MEEFETAVSKIFKEHELTLTDAQRGLFHNFYEKLLEANARFNLTRITGPREAAEKHFFDSASILKYPILKPNAAVLDIGSGAGFPGIPLLIMRPDLTMTLLESSEKKAAFLQEAVSSLSLNAKILCNRAEALGRDAHYRGQYDCVLSRAVARLPVLLELCVPFVKTGGVFVAYKGAGYEEERMQSETAISRLGISFTAVHLPHKDRAHALLIFRKIKKTDTEFPRPFARIRSHPL